MKNLKYIMGLFLTLLLFASCEKEVYTFGDIISPSNVAITAEIVGQDDANPYGDGSGTVNFTVTADHAITYKFIQDGSVSMSATGNATFNFGNTGIHKYIVTAVAIGTGGLSSSTSIELDVFAAYEPPAELLTMLTADNSRTWRVKAEAFGHFGVGPVDSDTPIWWGAAANDKAGKGAYDDQFIFNVDGSFTHITNGDAYGKAVALTADFGDKGQVADGDGEFPNYPLDDYTEEWALSAPGGVETLTFSNVGYHGFYVGGDHSYTILARSANEMTLRTIGADGLGWFVILIAD